MGMFDNITVKTPLPLPAYQDEVFQTKDTPLQWMTDYVIREDKTLWHSEHDYEDRSDPNAEGLMRICGSMTRINERWVQDDITDHIRFYTSLGEYHSGWVEFKAHIVRGILQSIEVVEERLPNPVEEERRKIDRESYTKELTKDNDE